MSVHVHHFIVESSHGEPSNTGRCRGCGAVREFPASHESIIVADGITIRRSASELVERYADVILGFNPRAVVWS